MTLINPLDALYKRSSMEIIFSSESERLQYERKIYV